LIDDVLSSDPVCPSPSDRPGAISAEARKRKGNGEQSEPVVKRRGVLLEDIALPRPDFHRGSVENAASQDVVMHDVKDVKPGLDVLGQRRKAVLVGSMICTW
jgi:hypothetical protein